MNLIEPNLQPDNSGQNPDELDRLLRAFFRAQLPHPWPALKLPAGPADQSSPASWWTHTRSRLALAASVALLMVGSWWLSGRTVDYVTPIKGVSPGVGDANSGPSEKIRKEQEKRNEKDATKARMSEPR